jgi:imidazoleglycerol-phosphate dehydratase/histidinol-phosphatase
MVTNQDGLGTDSFPEADFEAPHQKMLDILAGEGIHFHAIHIDRSFAHENLPTRKPGTAMLTEYFDAERYDLSQSYVIGDRPTDVLLAKNLGCKAIFIQNYESPEAVQGDIAFYAQSWPSIYDFLAQPPRRVQWQRKTQETDVVLDLNLDGKGCYAIETGLGFFNHMLDQLAKHGQLDLNLRVHGDLHIDEHHTVEDTAIALGEAFAKALGDKRGIERYGYFLPMDDCRAQVGLDFGGRPWLVWKAKFKRNRIGDLPTELFYHFFKSFSDAARCNLYIKAKGKNEHHKIEAIFKAFARALKMAVRRDQGNDSLPSTKGIL